VRGRAPLDAAVAGVRRVGGGVLSSFATTAAVFGSLIFLEGRIGEVLGVVPLVMLLVLVASLIEAFLILPNHLSHGDAAPPSPRRADRVIGWLRARVAAPLTRWSVRMRHLALGLCVGLLILSAALVAGGLVKFAPFPELEGDQLEARLALAPAATLAETERAAEAVADALRDAAAASEDGPGLIRRVTIRFNENPDAFVSGRHLATVAADLIPSGDRATGIPELERAWRAAIPRTLDLAQLTLTEPTIGPQGRDIEVRLAHDDPVALRDAAEALKARFAEYAGVRDLVTDAGPAEPEFRVVPKPEAAALGLDAAGIARQLRAAFRGQTADEVLIGAERFDVTVRLDAEARDAQSDLDDFLLSLPGGGRAPLSAVADIVEERGVTRIHRIDRRPTLTVVGAVDDAVANAGEVVGAVAREAYPALRAAHPGLVIGAEGANAEGAETQASMLRGLLTGLAAVYALLALQFRSWARPFAVMAVIPLTAIGALWGHFLMGQVFSLPSMLGLVSLAGVVVNGSILLIQDLERARGGGAADLAAAAGEAARGRFRALFLTTVTTIAGVTPLLFETSLQAQVLRPMVVSIAFGLISATLLLLVAVPALYALFGDAPERREAGEGAAAAGA